MKRTRWAMPLIAALAAGTLALGGAGVASATGLVPSQGFDLSYPSCATTLPSTDSTQFTVVGIDDGLAYADRLASVRHPGCLMAQLAWAKASGSQIQLYANTGNPGGPILKQHDLNAPGHPVIGNYTVTHWPSLFAGTSATKPRACTSKYPDTLDCAYDYGYAAAASSFARAKIAFTQAGITTSPKYVMWWLDLEIANTWRGHDPEFTNPRDKLLSAYSLTLRNNASMQGEVDYFVRTAKVKQLGLYGSPNEWDTIMGTTRAFAHYPFWYPIGPRETLADAMAACNTARNVTGSGLPALVQYGDAATSMDANVNCGQTTTLTPATVAPVRHLHTFILKATLSASTGIGLAGEYVRITYGGTSYVVRTNSYGIASVRLTAGRSVGTSTATFGFGSTTYVGSGASTQVSVN